MHRRRSLLAPPLLAACAAPTAMHRRRSLLAPLLLAACAAPTATVPPPRPTEPVVVTPASPPTPAVAPPDAPPVAPAIETSPAPVDPSRISGHVSSREGSRDIPPRFTARVTALDAPPGEGMATWRIALADTATAAAHELKVDAPAALPAPLRAGDVVDARVGSTGGGPNFRRDMVFTSEGLGLLLAVNQAPDAWKISRGPAGPVDRGDDYVERTHGVTFEHAGVRVSVAAGAWASMTVGPATYYVWGSGAQRRLRPGKRPMPDYVEGWRDFAIVRAR
jgi:hypothetical protein